jgi:hypothetical protein
VLIPQNKELDDIDGSVSHEKKDLPERSDDLRGRKHLCIQQETDTDRGMNRTFAGKWQPENADLRFIEHVHAANLNTGSHPQQQGQ